MQGIGNDFVLFDAITDRIPAQLKLAAFAREVCDRHNGAGADGLLLLSKGTRQGLRMDMLNPDGTLSEMCGNGLRCMALFSKDRGHLLESETVFETGAGDLKTTLNPDGTVTVEMGNAQLRRGDIGMTGDPASTFIGQEFEGYEATAVSMGNPHLVLFVKDLDTVDLSKEGPLLEHHKLFPQRVNVHFAVADSPKAIRMMSWERGAGATLACGTGACAVAVAGFATNRSEKNVEISLPGGKLSIELYEGMHVRMTGPASYVYEAEWPLSSLAEVVVQGVPGSADVV